MVFWCSHSRSSEEVRKEYTAAIEQQKEVLPLLIDDTPLPAELAEYQYIDFRAAFPHGHAADKPSPAPSTAAPPSDSYSASERPLSRAPAGGFPWLTAVLLFAAVVGIWTRWSPPLDSGPGLPGPSGPPQFPFFLLALLAFLVAIIATWMVKRSRKRQLVESARKHSVALSEQQRELATTIERELLSRIQKAKLD